MKSACRQLLNAESTRVGDTSRDDSTGPDRVHGIQAEETLRMLVVVMYPSNQRSVKDV